MDKPTPHAVEIPDFKLAKVGVGKKSERKRGGLGLFGAQGSGLGPESIFGSSGVGAGGFFGPGMSLAKLLVMVAVAGSVSAGAWSYGHFSSADAAAGKAGAKIFTDRNSQKTGDSSKGSKAQKDVPSSLSYVSGAGAGAGLASDARAQKAAGEAAGKSADDAKNGAGAAAGKQAGGSPAAPTGPDALALAAQAPTPGLTNGKFGRLNSSLGGGGPSGGAGSSMALNAGANGMGGPNRGVKPQNGALSAFHASAGRPGMSASAHAAAPKSKAQGFAKGQLNNAFAQSRQAVAGGAAETAASSAGAPFDNNSTAGSVIDGPGVTGSPESRTFPGSSSSNPSTGGGGGSGSPISSAAACPAGEEPNSSGVCEAIATPTAVNGSKDQWMIDAAKALMVVLGVLSALFIVLFSMLKTAVATANPSAVGLAKACAAIGKMILVTGIAITVLGLAYMAATGDILQGGIITAVGAMATVLALVPVPVLSLPMVAAGELIVAAGGYMATAGAQHPAAMQ